MSRPGKSKRERWANLIAPHIPTAPAAPITVLALQRLTNLRRNEVTHGVGELRDQMVTNGRMALVSDHTGYRYTLDEAEVAAFRSLSTRRAYTTIRRCHYGAIRPFLASLPKLSPEARQVEKQMTRVLEDLGELVGANGRSYPIAGGSAVPTHRHARELPNEERA